MTATQMKNINGIKVLVAAYRLRKPLLRLHRGENHDLRSLIRAAAQAVASRIDLILKRARPVCALPSPHSDRAASGRAFSALRLFGRLAAFE
jgi:hypothetical protein